VSEDVKKFRLSGSGTFTKTETGVKYTVNIEDVVIYEKVGKGKKGIVLRWGPKPITFDMTLDG